MFFKCHNVDTMLRLSAMSVCCGCLRAARMASLVRRIGESHQDIKPCRQVLHHHPLSEPSAEEDGTAGCALCVVCAVLCHSTCVQCRQAVLADQQACLGWS
jgi:hypothetical protein